LIEDARFACQPGCTKCCEQEGFVYLTEEDVPRIAGFLEMTVEDFERRYLYRTEHQRRLRVAKKAPCVFLKEDGCSIHLVKPTQCRIFPFWPELVENKRNWRKTAAWCPGIGQGELVRIEDIRPLAQEMRAGYPSAYKK
jgi:Fe-S-cluster containining protein